MTPNRKAPYVRLRINIDATVNAHFEMLPEIHDPVTRNPRYGERSKIIQELIIKYLESRGVKLHAGEVQ